MQDLSYPGRYVIGFAVTRATSSATWCLNKGLLMATLSRPRLKQLVKSVGVGPWGSGLSFGDSTLGFLAAWIGHAAAAGGLLVIGDVRLGRNLGRRCAGVGLLPLLHLWREPEQPMPGPDPSAVDVESAQVHSFANCQACIKRCNLKTLPKSVYWLPDEAP